MRCADLGPTPGRQRSASISSSRAVGDFIAFVRTAASSLEADRDHLSMPTSFPELPPRLCERSPLPPAVSPVHPCSPPTETSKFGRLIMRPQTTQKPLH